jgi:hypothetical protein
VRGGAQVDNRAGANVGRAAHDRRAPVAHPSPHAAIRVSPKEVNEVPNPLAIGVTIGGLLLDIVVPRPKPRLGYVREYSPPTQSFAGSRTPWQDVVQHDGPPVASGNRSL